MDWWPTALVVVLAMGFTYTNGFHDAANAIATSVSTRALTPRIALGLAALMNLLGAFVGVRVAQTIGNEIVTVPVGGRGFVLCVGALVGATVWNLVTWWWGMPSSSSHALIGGLCGAALAAGATVRWASLRDSVLVPMLVSPVVGLLGAVLVVVAIAWLFRRASPGRTLRGFRYAQTVSAAAMAFGHGMQDATKSAGVVALALVAGGRQAQGDLSVPFWVIGLAAAFLAAGTYAGGWRIVRTLGRRIVQVDAAQGFAAEATAASVLYIATATGAPVSTTHAITSAVTGVGLVDGPKAVRWGVVRSILVAWVLTLPAAGLLAALVSLVLLPLT